MALVRYEIEDAVARITLDAPQANVLSEALLDELIAALATARDDPAVRAVVLTSANPRVFSGGLDLPELARTGGKAARPLLQKLYVDLFDLQHELGKPSIAAIEGAARGGGLTIAISCNIMVAAESATFGYPEIDLGLIPAIHFVHLPRIVGRHRAFDLLFSGRSFSAADAMELGLVSQIAPTAGALDEALSLAATFAAKSPGALCVGRAAFMDINDAGYRSEIAKVVDAFCELAEGASGREGVAAFVEKRPPDWG